MFIIFGWRSFLKTIGAVFKHACPNCHNEKFWILTRVSRWFTLFFIPAIPTSSKYFLTCPICKYGTQLNDEQIRKFKPIAEANTLLVKGAITETEYKNRLGVHDQTQVTDEINKSPAQPVTIQEMPAAETMNNFCKNCGTRLTGAEKFCGECGNIIVRT